MMNRQRAIRQSCVLIAVAGAFLFTACTSDATPDALLESVSLIPNQATLDAGDTQQFVALGSYDDGATRDVSADVVWASSDSTVVSLDELGLATGVSAGAAEITATLDGITSPTAAVEVFGGDLVDIDVLPAVVVDVPAGATQRFVALGLYDNGSSADISDTVTWTSSDDDVATVDASGLAVARSEGVALITATLDGITSDPATFGVIGADLIAIELTPSAGTLEAGSDAELEFEATGLFEDGTSADITKVVTWASSDGAVAAVDADGIVTAGNESGSVEITATLNNIISGPALVVVLPSTHITDVEVMAPNASAPAGFIERFTATATYADGRTENVTATALWSSSDNDIAWVDPHGILECLAPGEVTVSATIGGVSGDATFEVTDAVLEALHVEPETASVPVGMSADFTATGWYSDGTATDLSDMVDWSSSDSDVLEVATDGTATGVAPGDASVVVQYLGESASADVAVTDAELAAIEIDPAAPAALPLGMSQGFTATAIFTDQTMLPLTYDSDLTWTSGDTSVAQISNAPGSKGVATGIGPGGAEIGAIFDDGTVLMNATPVVLSVVPAELEMIEVSPSSATSPAGFELQYEAVGHFSDGTLSDITAEVMWKSSKTSVATISNADDSEGVASANAPGAAIITAELGGKQGAASLTVSVAELISISVAPPAVDVAVGLTQQFTATGNFDDGSTMDLTTIAVWSVAPEMIGLGVTVSNATDRHGLATVSPTAQPNIDPVGIYASHEAVAGIAHLTVVQPVTLVGIIVDAEPTYIPVGLHSQATALGLYSDGVHPPTSLDITSKVVWAPLVGGVVAISNAPGTQGLITGIGDGAATINACLGAVCANDANSQGATDWVVVTSCPYEGLEIVPDDILLPAGTSRQYSVLLRWDDDAAGCGWLTGKAYDVSQLATWFSSHPLVATVSNAMDKRGLVTAADDPPSSYVMITAVYGDLNGSIVLDVVDACVSDITLSPATLEMPAGVRQQVTAMADLTNGDTVPYTDLADWQVIGALALVDPGLIQSYTGSLGVLTASSPATATCPSVSTDLDVDITDGVLTEILLDPSQFDLAIGTFIKLDAFGNYSDGSTWEISELATWTSSNSLVASAGPGGRIDGESSGTAVILATRGTVSGTATANVGGIELEDLDLELDASFPCGDFDGAAYPADVEMPLRAIATYSDGSSMLVTAMVTWWIGSGNAASVSADGILHTEQAGTAVLHGSFNGVEATLTIDVADSELLDISIEPGNGFVIAIDAKRKFTATGHYKALISGQLRYDECLISDVVAWQALPAPSLSISGTGMVTTTSTPTTSATITATLHAVATSISGAVAGVCIEGIELTPANATTGVGVAKQFFADLILSDGSTQDVTYDPQTQWSSSNPALVTVDNGIATPIAAGNVNIWAWYEPGDAGCDPGQMLLSATSTLDVSPASLMHIGMDCNDIYDLWYSPGGTSFGPPAGIQLQCDAWGKYSDGTIAKITDAVWWVSNNPLVLSVSNAAGTHGRVTTLQGGFGNITANLDGVVGSQAVTVVGATLAEVEVAGPDEMPEGFSDAFSAQGRFELNNFSRFYDVTDLATWTSSGEPYAVVSNAGDQSGVVMALQASPAPVLISAFHMGIAGSQALTVLAVDLDRIEVHPYDLDLALGQSVQYVANGVFLDGLGGSYGKDITHLVTWGTTDPLVATISPNGWAKAAGIGSAAITAEFDDASGSAMLQVEDKCITHIELVTWTSDLPTGVPLSFYATAMFTSGPPADVTSSVQFATSDAGMMPAPDATGRTYSVAGALPGNVVISAALTEGTCASSVMDEVLVTLNSAALTEIDVLGGSGNVPLGTDRMFYAFGRYSNGSSWVLNETIDAWETGSNDVAQVSNTPGSRGRVSGVGLGSTPLVATQGAISGSLDIDVVSATLEQVTVQGYDSMDACRLRTEHGSWTEGGFMHPYGGFTTWVRAWGHYSDGSVDDITDSVAWTSSASSRATVSNVAPRGMVETGSQYGLVNLTATSTSGVSGWLQLNVVGEDLDSLELNPAGPDPVKLALGNTAQLELVGRFGDDWFCVTADASFDTLNPNVAGVINSAKQRGLVVSKGLGSAMVTAHVGAVNDMLQVQVADPDLEWLEIEADEVELFVSETAQLRGYAFYSDGTVNEVTFNSLTTWHSDAPGIVGVTDIKGMVLAAATGEADVDFCFMGICASDSEHTCRVEVVLPE